MTTNRSAWYWCVLGTVAMSLGWGLRGSIGGGSLGAMIPGAMIGLVLCLLLNRQADAGLVAAFAAIGVGFGGQETYGQTVGLSLLPETFWWAILGFVVKGAVWGLLGGAFIGMALDRHRYTNAQLVAGFAIMVLGTWLGWLYLNSPKLIYFSNRFDRPREELWAGLWLGGLLLLAWLRSRVPSLFALYGAIGGGVGGATSGARYHQVERHAGEDGRQQVGLVETLVREGQIGVARVSPVPAPLGLTVPAQPDLGSGHDVSSYPP